MVFLNKLKKKLKSNNNTRDNNRFKTFKSDNTFNSGSFKYLNDLIQSGDNEISINQDIILAKNEEYVFSDGIFITKDNLVIDGNNHYIDAGQKIRIFHVSAKNIVFKNIKFKCGKTISGGAIFNAGGHIKFINCEFIENNSEESGGAISNFGKIVIIKSKFILNSSQLDAGGAIANHQEGVLIVSGCEFVKNFTEKFGGSAINNYGIVDLKDSIFNSNHAIKGEGGAIANRSNSMTIVDCEFINNEAVFEGGAIFNKANLNISYSTFKLNMSHKGNSISNRYKLKIDNCSFFEHLKSSHTVFNAGELDIIESIFKDIKSRAVVWNDSNAHLSISGGEFTDNNPIISTIYNLGEYCSLRNCIFKDNKSDLGDCSDIYNKTNLEVQKLIFNDNLELKTILNKGKIDVRGMSHSLFEKKTDNQGNFRFLEFDSNYEELRVENNDLSSSSSSYSNFGDLNHLIRTCKNNFLSLNGDICLDNYEIDFYQGGIELDIDDLIIEGNHHVIDGNDASRIFFITGKNIKLKNIIFQNGNSKNDYNKNIEGGGAIKIIKDSEVSLENCKFINNRSNGDGGAIFNNGILSSLKNNFKDNETESEGGAIFNKGVFSSDGDSFNNNGSSKLSSAIYNYGVFEYVDITLLNNKSNLSQQIFNDKIIKTKDNVDLDLIYNIGDINKKEEDSLNDSFKDLKYLLDVSNEISLNKNILFNYKLDKDLKKGILIDNDEDLIIEGNGHFIDGAGIARLFDIKSNINIIFKNIIFQNGYSHDCSIISNFKGNVTFENCKFDHNFTFKKGKFIENNAYLKFNNSIVSNNISYHDFIINKGTLIIFNSKFIKNISQKGNIIVNCNESILKIESTDYLNHQNNFGGTVILNKFRGHVSLSASTFLINTTDAEGACLINKGDMKINNFSIFIKNFSKEGGLIKNYSNLKVFDSKFISNLSNLGGSCLINWGDAILKISKFDENKVLNGGGGALDNQRDGVLKIYSCEFNFNEAQSGGGGLANYGIAHLYDSNFVNNIAITTFGGGIYNTGVLNINSCIFSKNKSLIRGGAIGCVENGKVHFNNCSFENNSPDDVN